MGEEEVKLFLKYGPAQNQLQLCKVHAWDAFNQIHLVMFSWLDLVLELMAKDNKAAFSILGISFCHDKMAI